MEAIVEKISEIVAWEFGVTVDDILGDSHSQHVCDARTVLAYSLYDNPKTRDVRRGILNGVEISKYIGCSATGIYYHIKKYHDLKFNPVFAKTLKLVEDAVEPIIKQWREEL